MVNDPKGPYQSSYTLEYIHMPHSVLSDMDKVSHTTHASILYELYYYVSFSATAVLQAAVSVFVKVIIIIAFY